MNDSRYIFRILLLEICILISRCMYTPSLQLCPTLCDPMNCSLLGSSVHGIFPARILEWFAMPSSRGSSQLTERICISCISCIASRLFAKSHKGSPISRYVTTNTIFPRYWRLINHWKPLICSVHQKFLLGIYHYISCYIIQIKFIIANVCHILICACMISS